MTDFGPDHFIGGRLAIDFVNTADGRETRFVDTLAGTGDYTAWMTASGVWPETDAAALADALSDAGRARAFCAEATGLREAIHDALITRMRDGRPDPDALARIAQAYRSVAADAALATGPDGRTALDWSGARAETRFLAPIVMDALELLADARADRLKQCDGETCGWLFLDTSKAGRRRWCDMATCGNVSKARRHAARKRTG
jgi:predicted RNA-binding Zn ribbon-like protein